MAEEEWVMLVHGNATRMFPLPTYLKSFDPEIGTDVYIGSAEFTNDLAEAKRFPNFIAVLELWKQQSKRVPTRLDGKPKRPLTAFTVEPKKIPPARKK